MCSAVDQSIAYVAAAGRARCSGPGVEGAVSRLVLGHLSSETLEGREKPGDLGKAVRSSPLVALESNSLKSSFNKGSPEPKPLILGEKQGGSGVRAKSLGCSKQQII